MPLCTYFSKLTLQGWTKLYLSEPYGSKLPGAAALMKIEDRETNSKKLFEGTTTFVLCLYLKLPSDTAANSTGRGRDIVFSWPSLRLSWKLDVSPTKREKWSNRFFCTVLWRPSPRTLKTVSKAPERFMASLQRWISPPGCQTMAVDDGAKYYLKTRSMSTTALSVVSFLFLESRIRGTKRVLLWEWGFVAHRVYLYCAQYESTADLQAWLPRW